MYCKKVELENMINFKIKKLLHTPNISMCLFKENKINYISIDLDSKLTPSSTYFKNFFCP